MKNSARLAIGCLALSLTCSAAWAGSEQRPSTGAGVTIAELGHVVVGGERTVVQGLPKRTRVRARSLPTEEVDPNGEFTPGATYVHFTRLAKPRRAYPLLLLPGGSLSGAAYETTPDGRAGWEWFFLRAGYSVYVADLQQTGRSPWARFPEIDREEPVFRDRAFLWEVFRIGPPGSYAGEAGPRPYAHTQFPVGSFDAFAKLAAPRFRTDPASEAATYDAILEKVCPCVLLAHSASGGPSLGAAQRHPQLVKGIVVVEPASVPEPPTRAMGPHLIVWGDYLSPADTSPDWKEQYEASRRYLKAAAARSTSTTLITLPERGITGNSHLLMLDANSDQVAEIIDRWLRSHSL